MGRQGYPPEFRRKVLDLIDAGRKAADIARDLGISTQTIYNWRRQHRIDQGLKLGSSSGERADLIAARRRIAQLETELKVARRAAELFKDVKPPKTASRPSRSWPRRICRYRRHAGSLRSRSPGSMRGAHGHPLNAQSAMHGSLTWRRRSTMPRDRPTAASASMPSSPSAEASTWACTR